ncbi:M4 family metallopeptidase [Pseudalkalibacillus hwajinpoensis]|uniref:Neutral metalloproteinase n=1 Tax=Guptibacillus hwajinpoensis TaxID=208199 RepID=A0A4V5PYV1_9BACL|nr:M4 family metallopeptidase [Pseudalkalibacillus hwajinpoensis]TKD71558.1 peptidase M4 family protein [Pseudalkalibacillus hwajinpoensis]
MKKGIAVVLATGLAFGSALPAAASSNDLKPEQKQALEKMEIVKQNWENERKVPSFLSGKLSEKNVKTEKAIQSYLKSNESLFKVKVKDLELISESTDDLGMTHYEYVQTVKGVSIDGARFIVHTNETGEVVAVNGDLHPDANKNFKGNYEVKLSEKEAVKEAWNHINVKPKNTVSDNPSFVKKSNASDMVEKSEKVVYQKDNNYYMTYKVQLQFIDPYPANWQIFVDARDGSIVDSYNAVTEEATTGHGTGVLGDNKSLNTYYSNGTYYLYDTTKPMNGVIETRTAFLGNFLPGNYSTDDDNAFTDTSQGADVDANYYAGTVYDYYYNTHNRNSFDNNGATIRSTVHYGSNYNNAFWNGSQMVYGDGDGTTFAPLSGAQDVVAHEITHAVTERTAGLKYQDQSGALNESMSDVFGYFVEPEDFLLGEDVYTPNKSGDALRSLSNPEAYGQPSHMDDYYNTSSDNGGVHTNSGIPNKAAYLTIQSIGKSKAEQIYYRALSVYLTPTSNFSEARSALLQATTDLYGTGTTYNSVANAWTQVGVN